MKKGARTKQFIVSQAAPLFNMRGAAGTSVQDIMEATQLAKGGLYGNFDTKEEILLASFEHMMGVIGERLREVLGSAGGGAGAQLYALVEFYRAYALDPVIAGGCPILNFGVEADDMIPALRERLAQQVLYYQGRIQEMADEGVRTGEFRKGWDTRRFAVRMFALIEGGILVARICQDKAQMDVLMDMLKEEIAAQIIK
ncbi:TetR/AcrR family transcriptional regulator [Chitinophaga pendula]|uniref:TetR/AcrR family transcriptional regulator n=1 Tax=Chitinophaga TaxID=79328 RepID=UPI000BB00197|nr:MULTISPECIES: TetR/AcrR family transcriptional regulator [Chitinophaga]ASZ11736.1 TetR family transcriptional regulator [Chitinophaga sp. MD30]UCJ05245.1 TetR/AcrR family transcriptional regulator [Chitinophaga pendula]